jgi:hypothetical protein
LLFVSILIHYKHQINLKAFSSSDNKYESGSRLTWSLFLTK